jgi:serine/threonine-protein kinase SRK2
MGVKYSFPSNLQLSRECLDLISQVFVANPANRVTLKGLKQHPWFLQNLPDELKASPATAHVSCKRAYVDAADNWRHRAIVCAAG